MNTTAQITPIRSRWRTALPAPIRHDLDEIHRLMAMALNHDGEEVSLEELERVVVIALEHGVVEAIERELAVASMDEAAKDQLSDRLREAAVIRGVDGFMAIVALAFTALTEMRMYDEYGSFPDADMAHAAARVMTLWGLMCTPGLCIPKKDDTRALYLVGTDW